MQRHHLAMAALASTLATTPAHAIISYHTVELPGAVGSMLGAGAGGGFIRGDGTDMKAPGINPNGSLAAFVTFNLPFNQPDLFSYFKGTASWDTFSVTGNTVRVERMHFDLQDPDSFGSLSHVTDAGPSVVTATLDGTMHARFTTDYEYLGPVSQWVGGHTQIDWEGAGGYVLNVPSLGLHTARAEQFMNAPFGAPSAQASANYLNYVTTLLPGNWTAAGLWQFEAQLTPDNTRGLFADALIGGTSVGYQLWYSTDSFLFGQPLSPTNDTGIFSAQEVQALIATGKFPELGGLKLAGGDFAQLYDLHSVSGDGAIQTIVINYDETKLLPGEEARLQLAHFVNGAWEIPLQTLDTLGNTITVRTDSFSPFALVVRPVPLPPAALLLGGCLVALGARRRSTASI